MDGISMSKNSQGKDVFLAQGLHCNGCGKANVALFQVGFQIAQHKKTFATIDILLCEPCYDEAEKAPHMTNMTIKELGLGEVHQPGM